MSELDRMHGRGPKEKSTISLGNATNPQSRSPSPAPSDPDDHGSGDSDAHEHSRQRSGFNLSIAKSMKTKKSVAPKAKPKGREINKDRQDILVQFEKDVAPLGAMACWNLGLWDKMNHFVKRIAVRFGAFHF